MLHNTTYCPIEILIYFIFIAVMSLNPEEDITTVIAGKTDNPFYLSLKIPKLVP